MVSSSVATLSCERAAAAWRSNGRIWRRTSRTRSPRRSRFSAVPARRRSARSRRRRCLRTPAASSMMARRSSGRAFNTVSSWPCPMIMCCWRPTPESERSSCTSRRRQGAPLMAYSLSPDRKRVRVIVTSARSIGSFPEALSMVSETSARPSAGRDEVPAKMTSSILAERSERGPCAPRTQVTASTTFDLPLPLGPTTTVIPGSNSSTVGSANDLNPFMLSDFRNIAATLQGYSPTGLQPGRPGRGGRAGRVKPGSARRRTSSAHRS